jgi:hypothetical protein
MEMTFLIPRAETESSIPPATLDTVQTDIDEVNERLIKGKE